MLQNIRDNAQGVIAKVIVGLIVMTFAFFGVESIVGGLSGEPEVASVNGEPITKSQFERQFERNRLQAIASMGENYDPSKIDENKLRKTTLDEFIAREVQLQAAREAGFAVSDATINNFITQWPMAQKDGKYDNNQFMEALRRIGMRPLEFRKELSDELLVGQLQSGIAQTSFVIGEELNELLRMERQTRSFSYYRLNAEDVAKDIQISDVEAEEYYNANKDEFILPERIIVNYIELTRDALVGRAEVSDEEISARYEQEKKDFHVSEQRRAAHILIETSDDVSDEQALAKAKEVEQKLKDGGDFAALAKEFSNDLGSANDGGDLGYAQEGAFVKPFEEKLFSMNVGEISEPVKTEYGYHIIKLNDVKAVEMPSLEESRDRIVKELQEQKADSLFVEVNAKLKDVTYTADDLAGPAEELGLTVQTSEPFSREGGQGIFSGPQVIQEAFSADVIEDGHNSQVIDLGKEGSLVLRKKELLPSVPQQFAEVKESIKQKLAVQKAKDSLAAKSEEMVAQLKSGDLAPVSKGADGEQTGWVELNDARRSQAGAADIARLAFKLPKPAEGKPVIEKFETNFGYAVIVLNEVKDNTEDLSEAEQKTYRTFMASRNGQREYSDYNEKIQDAAEIERL
ncbi:SurA N-terminal domain-containing protein [Hahella aquimaris]|uniref:SurA N-terminal domain-containing protein n=1 Tax=Hahella sp. HNIBRBA332 TaxID=3015983 RepID=UPI00273ADA96|nr:SurA N-terminal domain-containing protein [Hahella sp. HNIBRBA332]WLQ15296.1 SurA N-terminal domain-containing protein [Hahella sp. HNIBRBA332]